MGNAEHQARNKSREKAACAKHLGVDEASVTAVETEVDGGGHFIGFTVTSVDGSKILIPTGRSLNRWVMETLSGTEGLCQCAFPLRMHGGPRMGCPVRFGTFQHQETKPESGSQIHKDLINARISAAYADWDEGEAALDQAFEIWNLPHRLS